MADYTFPPAPVLVETTGEFAIGATGVLRPAEGGDPVQVYDLNDSPLAGIMVGPKGAHQAFKADVSDGILDFGSVLLPSSSLEQQRAGLNAVEIAQGAVTDVTAARDAAQAAASQAQAAAKFVIHGADADMPRPGSTQPVIWFGDVEPVNAHATLDVWVPITSAIAAPTTPTTPAVSATATGGDGFAVANWTITDPSGVVTSARVTLLNAQNTILSQETITGRSGTYRFGNLANGTTYTTTVQALATSGPVGNPGTATVTPQAAPAPEAPTTGYRYFRFQPVALRSGADAFSFAEFEIRNDTTRLTGMTPSNVGMDIPQWLADLGEGVTAAADNNPATKLTSLSKTTGHLLYDFGAAVTATGYRWVTSPDLEMRDPISWRVDGSPDGTTWTVLDQRVNYTVPSTRGASLTFTFGTVEEAPPPPVVDPTEPAPVSNKLASLVMPSRGWFSGGANPYQKDAKMTVWSAWRGDPVDFLSDWRDTPDGEAWIYGVMSTANDGTTSGFKGLIDIALGGPRDYNAAAGGSLDTKLREAMVRLRTNRTIDGVLYPTILRPFHEMNGNWYAWSAGPGKEAAFKACARRWKSVIESVFPEAILAICFNSDTTNGVQVDNLYEAGVWDLVGVDRYNAWPHVGRNRAGGFVDWETGANSRGWPDSPKGWNAWLQWAKARGLPLYSPEYAQTGIDTANPEQAGDDPYYFQNLYAWMKANAGKGAGQFLADGYFNIGPGAYGDQHWLIDENGNTNPNTVNSAAAYRDLFPPV